jgi:predicted nucleic-acid-binding Zn-ribbon protein
MSDPQKFIISGLPLQCNHCKNDKFHHQIIMLNTRVMTFLDLDWLNSDAEVFACSRCGHLMWFSTDAVTQQDDASEPTACLACDATIPPGTATCPKCGWSYK